MTFDVAFLSLGIEDSPQTRRQTLAFEDDPRGIQSARAAGLYVCALTTKFEKQSGALQAAGADEVEDSFLAYARRFGLELD